MVKPIPASGTAEPEARQAVDLGGGGSRRLAASRKAEVLATVNERGTIRVTDLAVELGVTAVTVRRDVAELAEQGLLVKVHGGATALSGPGRSTAGLGTGASGAVPHVEGPRGPRGQVSGVPASVSVEAAQAAVGSPDVEALKGRGVGMLVPSLDYYWPGVVRGAEEVATATGMRFTLRGSTYFASDERADADRLAGQVDGGGLLLAPTMTGTSGELMAQWLTDAAVPVVLVERSAVVGDHRAAVESVVTDHALGAGMAVHHLASLGHRRIGLATSAQSPHSAHLRRGWWQACQEHGIADDAAVETSLPDRREPTIEGVLTSLLEDCRRSGTTALLVHADPEAVRLVQRAQEMGMSAPGDLSVVAYDDEVAALSTPSISSVRPPRRTVGRAAVGLLTARLLDPGRPVHRLSLSPTLYVRESSGPPR